MSTTTTSRDDSTNATPVAVAPGQAVVDIDASLAARPVAAPNGVDVSGTVRDELGGIGVGYVVKAYDTPADPRDAEVVAQTISNRAGQYNFTELDRIGGETEFKIVVEGEGPREDGDFARRTTWSGDKLGYETATVVTAAPRVLDFTLPVAGGISGAVTSEAGGVAQDGFASFRNSDEIVRRPARARRRDGTYDDRALWAGDYTVRFGAKLPRLRVVERRPPRGRHERDREARSDDHRHLGCAEQGRQGHRAPRGRGQRVGREDRQHRPRSLEHRRPATRSATSGSSGRRWSPPASRSR